ncbi:MAG: RNA 2',3'-cyclic phosphodiesterase [Eubacteriales bacterium]
MKRLFAAIPIKPTPEFIDTYAELQTTLKHERITWVSSNNMHLTLKFFGETDERKIPSIAEALKNGTSLIPSFSLLFHKTGTFGSRYNPKVIWLGAEEQPILNKLAEQVKVELEKIGFEYDRQNFVPHLTLGRIRDLTDKELFQQVMNDYRDEFLLEQEITVLYLYESVLTPKGSIYTQLHIVDLKQQ